MSVEPGRKVRYSSDIGWKIIWKRLGLGMTFKEISKDLHIAQSTAHRIYKKFVLTGSVDAAKPRKRYECHKLDEYHELLLIALILEKIHVCIYMKCATKLNKQQGSK